MYDNTRWDGIIRKVNIVVRAIIWGKTNKSELVHGVKQCIIFKGLGRSEKFTKKTWRWNAY